MCLWQPMCATVAHATFVTGKVAEHQLLLTFTSCEATSLLVLCTNVGTVEA